MIANKSLLAVFALLVSSAVSTVSAAPEPNAHDVRSLGGIHRRTSHRRHAHNLLQPRTTSSASVGAARKSRRGCAKRQPAAVSRTELAAASVPTIKGGEDDREDAEIPEIPEEENGEDGSDSPDTPDTPDSPDSSDTPDNGEQDDNEGDNDDEEDDAPPSGGSPGAGAESVGALFPLGQGSKSWSTCSSAKGASKLSNDFLRPTKDMKSLSHDITKAPDGKAAMEAFYPKGSMNPGNSPAGGFSFYAPGPDNVGIEDAKEVTFGYSVYFDKGFDWVKGGKLPGVFGGNSFEDSTSCSGGRRDDKCFSARLMWRADGQGEFYNYLPPTFSANKKQCNVAPQSDCNDKFGASVGRGAFSFKDGAWTTVAERVKLNDVGKENGELEMFVNGESVISVKGLVLRGSDSGRFRGVQMQTFFGGSRDGFQASKDSKVWFKDFSLAVTENL